MPTQPTRFEDSPALKHRSDGYPARFNGRVPRRVRMLRNVHPDFIPMSEPGTVARHHDIYEAWTNSYGAVAAICANGALLGLKPHEFEVVEWHEEAKPPGENGEAFGTMPGGARPNGLPPITAGAMRAARQICIDQGRLDPPDFIVAAMARTIDEVSGLRIHVEASRENVISARIIQAANSARSYDIDRDCKFILDRTENALGKCR